MADALADRDSLPVMTSWGVSKLISDSGVIRYKVITEEWRVFDRTDPPRHEFLKGLFLERFDEKFNVDMFLTSDTAYWYNQSLWELRGRVFVRNGIGTTFSTEELFWDMEKHEFYSTKFARIITPERSIEGYNLRSNEQMTQYSIDNSKGYMPMGGDANAQADTTKIPAAGQDTLPPVIMREGPQKTAKPQQ